MFNRRSMMFLSLALLLAGPCFSFAKEKTILVIGDSLSAGYGVSKSESYPHKLESKLRKNGHKAKVVNGSESGILSSAASNRLQWYLKRVQPDVVIFALGGNDARQKTPLKQIANNLTQAIELAQKNNAKVVLAGMQIFPNLGKEYVEGFKALYPQLAKKHEATLIPFLLEGVAGERKLNQRDGFHPNAKGHTIMTETVYKTVKDLL